MLRVNSTVERCVLKAQPGPQLHGPRRPGARDDPEVRRPERRARQVEVGAIEQVVGFHAHIEFQAARSHLVLGVRLAVGPLVNAI